MRPCICCAVMDDPFVDDLWSAQAYTAERADVHARLVRETEERPRRAVTPHSTGVTCQVGRGQPSRQIIDVARERGIDVIVMGTHGRTGLAHLVTGSVAERVVRLAPCPVLTLRKDTAPMASVA